jgi:uncharacterized OB-fold protein
MAGATTQPVSPPTESKADPSREPPPERPPYLLDFFPLEGPQHTRLSAFFDHLKAGRLTTTKCPKDGTVTWPPRVVCPKCHQEELDWVDLPTTGKLYSFSAVLVGAPLGMEAEMPYAVGLIDLDGVSLRLFSRIVGRGWEQMKIGDPVRFEPFGLNDGRVFYRFRTLG